MKVKNDDGGWMIEDGQQGQWSVVSCQLWAAVRKVMARQVQHL